MHSVAVIIPFYNGSQFIERAVKSVLRQSVQPSEFIVVNDGSSEDEARKLDDLSRVYQFRVLDKENGGQGSARNAGVAATTSNLISFLDQDDFYLDDHIETLLSLVPSKDPRFGWAYGDLFEADGEGNVFRNNIVTHHCPEHPKQNIITMLRFDMFVLPSASLISRRAFEDVGGFDAQFTGFEDDDLFLRLFRAGWTNYFTSKPVTVWCIHGQSTSYSIKMVRSRFRYFNKLLSTYQDDPQKGRFFLRDIFIPRFHNLFLAEAIASLDKSKPLHKHQDEVISIFSQYVKIVDSSPFVGENFKRYVKLQRALIGTRSEKFVGIAVRTTKLITKYVRRNEENEINSYRQR